MNSEMTDPYATTQQTKVARDLSEIGRLDKQLGHQAANKSTDRDLPGGNAMVMLAPVSSIEARENRIDGAERWNLSDSRGARPTRDLSHTEDEDEHWEPPLQSLLFWSEQWRVEHGRETDSRPTIDTESAFLRECLNWAWDNELHFDEFAKDVRRARVRMENTLLAGFRPELTRVHCIDPDCQRKPRLQRVYEARAENDHYRCPACRAKYDHQAFMRARHVALDSDGAARFVKVQDAVAALDRPERTFRKWMAECRILSYCERKSHQVWVWWPDVRDLDVETQRRNRPAA